MNSPFIFRPAIPLLICLILGIVTGSGFKGLEIWAGTIAAVSAVGIMGNAYRRRSAIFLPFVFFFALGYLSILPWLQPRFPANHIVHFAGTRLWDITGGIDQQPRTANNRTRLILNAATLAHEHRFHEVVGKLRVTVIGQLPGIAAGDEVRFTSRIRLITNFKNPGGFDYRRYMAFKGVWNTAYVRADRLTLIKQQSRGGITAFVANVRSTLAGLIDQTAEPAAGAVLKALIIGDRSQISPKIRQDFNRAGVGHLLAISGLHIGIVATVAFVFFQALMVRVKPLLWQARTRKMAAVMSILPVLFYGTLAGFSPSTQRAVIMVTVFLMTFLFESEQDPLNTLALAALVILIADPPALFSISFQLSFTAVLAIVYGLARLPAQDASQQAPLKDNRTIRFRRKLAAFFLVSLFAVCGSLPLVAYYFNQISLIGLAANFIAVPLIGFVCIPLGLAALFILPLSLSAALWSIKAAALILSSTLELITWIADLPFAAVKVATPSLLEITCFYIMGWALLNLRPRESRMVNLHTSPPDAVERDHVAEHCRLKCFAGHASAVINKFRDGMTVKLLRPAGLAPVALVLILIVVSLDAGYWLHQRYWHTDLRVTIIDVGDGSASLLELPGGYTIMVDGGGFSDNSAFDVGERIVAPLLWRKKIQTVDTLILSHPNSDHLNGLIYIARHFNVKNIWSNNEPASTRGYAKFLEVIKEKNIRLAAFKDLPRMHRIGGVEFNILYPPTDFLKLKKTQKWRDTNNNSLVVKATLDSISFLFPGDILAAAEAELVRLADDSLESTVLIAPHHGSKTSSSKIFIDAVDPEAVILSSSRNGRFKFPHPAVIKRYTDHGCKIWRTDLNGAVQIATDGRRLQVNAFYDLEL